MVVEARKLVDNDNEQQLLAEYDPSVKAALNALGYEEAAQHVYGMTYAQWKARHQKKATDEQMERYKASEPLQAKHDKQLLATRGEKPTIGLNTTNTATAIATTTTTTLSNVCCQDVEQVASASSTKATKDARTIGPYTPPPLPSFTQPVRIAVLTVSDRAFNKQYATGDLSGPAVVTAVQLILAPDQVQVLPVEIVPDDTQAIQKQLLAWATQQPAIIDIILTTGGTGMAPRDVTPEATRDIVTTEMAGLMSFVATECSRLQPLASLTRGTAGILPQQVLVANLPGNPRAVGEILPILLPLLLHAWQDLRAG